MKRIPFILYILLIMNELSIEAQQIKSTYYTNQAINKGDSVALEVDNFYGDIQWQKSKDLNYWENMEGYTHGKAIFIADSSAYFRAKIVAGTCNAIYSDTILISPYMSYDTTEGLIGYGGGKIAVTDSSNSLNGTSIIIPEGAIESDTIIKFSQSTFSYHYFNDTNNISVSFQPDGLHFNKKIELTIPYNGENIDSVVIYYYDPLTSTIEIIYPSSFNSDKKLISFYTEHFSNYTACKNYQSYPYKQEYSLNNDINRYDPSLPFPQYTYLMQPVVWLGWYYDYSNYKRNLGLAPIGYPHILYGKSPCNSAKSTTKNLPCELKKILELYATFDAEFYYEKYPRDLDLVFDIWLTNSDMPNESNITGEIMIWDYKGDITLPNSKTRVATVSIDGIGYELWKYNHGDFPGCEVYNFLPVFDNTNTRNRKVDILKFINILFDKDQIQDDQKYLSSITFGNEIWYGIGHSVINDYSISIKSCGGNYDIVFNPDLNYGILKDIDGNSYKTIQIGNQTWMAENLKTTKYNDNTKIPLVTDVSIWSGLNTPAYCWFVNDICYKYTFGALYNFYTINTNKLCPIGWHVPTNEDWVSLENYYGGNIFAGAPLKEVGTSHWASPNIGATNESGFTALPGGYREYAGYWASINYNGLWWSSTEIDNNKAYYRSMCTDNIVISTENNFRTKKSGFSVRCIKN
jgi:uncharacterized protein (TIGR02145 family)